MSSENLSIKRERKKIERMRLDNLSFPHLMILVENHKSYVKLKGNPSTWTCLRESWIDMTWHLVIGEDLFGLWTMVDWWSIISQPKALSF